MRSYIHGLLSLSAQPLITNCLCSIHGTQKLDSFSLQFIQNVDVLLLFPLLLLCRRGEIVEVLASESLLDGGQFVYFNMVVNNTHQIVVGEVDNVTRLDAEVLKRLGLGIDDLVQELSLDLISRHSVPPKHLVQQLSDRLQDSLRHVEVSSLLVNLLVNHDRNLLHAVLLRTVKLEGLSCSGVVKEDLLKSSTDIN